MSRFILFGLVSALAACGSSSSGGSPGGGDDSGTSSGGFSLRVTKAGLTSKLGVLSASSGNVFVVVDLTLSNDSVASSLSESAALFTVTTKAALVVRASPASAVTATPCRPEVAVGSGGTATCQLAFEIATSDVAATLGYDDAQGHTATAAVPAARNLPPAGSLQPPARPTVTGEGGTTQWFVVDSMLFDPWMAYGYDLDARITTAADSKTSNGTCQRKAGSSPNVLVDGNGGIDNSFGAHFVQTLAAMGRNVEHLANSGITSGKGTLLLRLDNVGGADNASVPGALFATGASSAPAFDGSDVLPVSSDSVDGALDKPLASFPGAFMAGGVWVSGDLPGDPFDVPLLFSGARSRLPLAGGVITVQVADGKNGIIAGVTAAAAFGDAMTPWAKSVGICPGNATFDEVFSTFTQSADLIADAPGFEDTARECDAISVGLGFTMVKAQPPTTIVDPSVPADACK